MNPGAVHVALVIGGIAMTAFVIAMLLLGGCRAALPPEPTSITVTARCATPKTAHCYRDCLDKEGCAERGVLEMCLSACSSQCLLDELESH